MNMLMSQCRMEIIRVLRNRHFIIASLVMPVMFYYIFTNTLSGAANDKAWQAQYLISMTAFSIIGSAINTLGLRLVQEKSQGWSRLMDITPLPAGTYLVAKMVAQTIINLFSIIVIFLVGALINNVELSAMQWIGSGAWILIGAFPFLALGTFIGTFKSIDTAAAVGNVLYMLLSILGGLWMPLEIMPKTIRAIGEWLPTYRFGHGAWNIVAGKMPDMTSIMALAGYMMVFIVLSIYIRKRQGAI
ncbi:ABC transporter permease [Ectobacillus sp. JY-23]|uniref:ABC transporter permease n=1 Tax=Ectobacillus sp. JY-23 TaxID=2933872 RepID=UPI001FF36599|nr:ABC transporter permease [Ectobacillus sp. JY-23]UOY92267.1 ABC transporter permease [Ectobacillus sp. JY-23]